MISITNFYHELIERYSPQGWWPLLEVKGTNPTKTGSVRGYHIGDYSYPKTDRQRFEICVGAILTQNTAWPNVEKALINLERSNALELKNFLKLSDGKLASRLAQQYPHITVILTSGLSEAELADTLKTSPAVGAIKKPFTLMELALAVRNALDQHADAHPPADQTT